MTQSDTDNAFPAQNDNISSENNPIANHPVLADITAACIEIERLEQELKRAKQQLHEDVKALPAKIGENEDLCEEIIYYLYWFHERAPKNTLKQAFNVIPPGQAGKNSTNVIKARLVEMACYDCRKPFQTEAKSSSYSGLGVCDACLTRRNQSWQTQQRQHQLEQERIRQLSTMPYREYLQTPEWNERRKRAMRRAGFRCQVCNSYGVQLNTHHRTYERRGDERDSDLITLCRTCHEIFHQNGQLAIEGDR